MQGIKIDLSCAGIPIKYYLIVSGVIVTALFGAFLYREIFPEYKIYQNDYVALEEFRSMMQHQTPPPFPVGVKQIVLEKEDNGPPAIDGAHLAMWHCKFPIFPQQKLPMILMGISCEMQKDDLASAK